MTVGATPSTEPSGSARWETYAFPVMGKLAVTGRGAGSCAGGPGATSGDKSETASRLRGRIENVLDWASARQYRTGDNPARWKGCLDKLLPAPSKVKKVEHHRALPIDSLDGFTRRRCAASMACPPVRWSSPS